jgi:hypothetical protein
MTKERPETLPDLVAGLASQLALPDFPKTEGADGVKVKRDELRENGSGGAGGPWREEGWAWKLKGLPSSARA